MKNIKTFNQLFENSTEDKQLKVVSFGENEFDKFRVYCERNTMNNWDPVKSDNLYNAYTRGGNKFYIINDKFLVMCKGDTIDDIRIINGADSNNKFEHDGDKMTEYITNKIECSVILLRIALFIAKITSEFVIDKETNMESANKKDILFAYFKKNPLQIYALDEYPELKREIIGKTGIKDYGSIGRKLRSGLI
jgi:hypothetical protein